MSNGNGHWGIIPIFVGEDRILMELKTKAVDRVLEALSPALAAELDRVVEEAREVLEKEFETRLKTAVHEAETATTAACGVQTEHAVNEAKDATRKQVTEELEQQFAEKLRDETTRLTNEASAEQARLQEQLDQWRLFAETHKQLAEASSQPEILSRFLRLSHSFADGLAVYVTKADGLALWKSRGHGAFPEIISQQTTDPESYFKVITVREKAV